MPLSFYFVVSLASAGIDCGVLESAAAGAAVGALEEAAGVAVSVGALEDAAGVLVSEGALEDAVGVEASAGAGVAAGVALGDGLLLEIALSTAALAALDDDVLAGASDSSPELSLAEGLADAA